MDEQDLRAVKGDVARFMADRASRVNIQASRGAMATERAEHLAWHKGRMNHDLGVMRQPRKITVKIGRNFKKTATQGLGMMSVARELHAASPILPTRHAPPGTVRPGYKRRSPKPAATHRMAWCRSGKIPGPWVNERSARVAIEAQIAREEKVLKHFVAGRAHRRAVQRLAALKQRLSQMF